MRIQIHDSPKRGTDQHAMAGIVAQAMDTMRHEQDGSGQSHCPEETVAMFGRTGPTLGAQKDTCNNDAKCTGRSVRTRGKGHRSAHFIIIIIIFNGQRATFPRTEHAAHHGAMSTGRAMGAV